jgi:hypothetical protein
VDAIDELRALYEARGETALAANLARHLSNVRALLAAKRSGDAWASEAWVRYAAATRSPEQRRIIAAAKQRKRELGLISGEAGGAPDDWGGGWGPGGFGGGWDAGPAPRNGNARVWDPVAAEGPHHQPQLQQDGEEQPQQQQQQQHQRSMEGGDGPAQVAAAAAAAQASV